MTQPDEAPTPDSPTKPHGDVLEEAVQDRPDAGDEEDADGDGAREG